ncbi:MarR family transcriptional regulator [Halobacillus halophilus]|uniref:MarR family transcription regulator n=1 Tax=Halobacillus halophilus (strain ATCC 35676 / DSM 2266 / JCM 20832 / KCTC 3685 / LMG 17431 / NBRC 102448 / NCIMB 2269) TaxID=866895 RepID=I0JPI0_HALH3|nr:MarR family transcriptional regulator [Halobacillus halophilus]ASF40087.1 MarR family transcriptional regulator [Halobacillus halophilus]CCG46050.1 MarR family transcription regulator [Halobacillus halophilus DSM 2266]
MSNQLQASIIADVEKELRYISGIIKQRGRVILNHYPITAPQFVALQWLLEKGDMTIGELSDYIHLACSTTTDLVDRMEKNKLVERVRDLKDRRVVRIHVLQKGEQIIHEVIEKRQDYLKEVLKDIPTDDVETLNNLLHVLHEKMRDADQEQFD